MANETNTIQGLPSYSLKPVPRLTPWLSDFHLSLVLPVAAYWLVSLIFWYIDKKDYFSQYRIHTPEEFKQRNRVTVGEVLRSILLQQAVQTSLGLVLGYLTDAGDFQGREDYDIAVWAGRVHRARDAFPWMLALLGIDAKTLAYQLQTYATSVGYGVTTEKPMVLLTSIFNPHLADGLTYGFAPWELWAAKSIYWFLEPAARFGLAIFFSDSWQYFWHRAMHSNKWMFRTSCRIPSLQEVHNLYVQEISTLTTTKSTFPTPSVLSTILLPKPLYSIPSVQPSRLCSPALPSAKPCSSAPSQ